MGNFKDLTGQKFGRLTAIKRTDDMVSPKGKHTTMWLCRCDCGNDTIVSRSGLLQGVTKSCGCLQKEIAHSTSFQDLTGMKFDRLTVLYRAQNNKYNKIMWHCICDCGKEVDINAASLKSGRTRSCGCLQHEKSKELNNEIREYDKNGNIISKRCQYCKRMLPINEFYKNSNTADGYSGVCKYCGNHSEYARFNRYKKGANARNLEFNLTKEDFNTITSQPCYYCGEYSGSYFEKQYSGIDRIDSSCGYNTDNVVSCCEMCNKMKLDYNISDWLFKMDQILKHLNYQEKPNG